jgi:hypothetical protein
MAPSIRQSVGGAKGKSTQKLRLNLSLEIADIAAFIKYLLYEKSEIWHTESSMKSKRR